MSDRDTYGEGVEFVRDFVAYSGFKLGSQCEDELGRAVEKLLDHEEAEFDNERAEHQTELASEQAEIDELNKSLQDERDKIDALKDKLEEADVTKAALRDEAALLEQQLEGARAQRDVMAEARDKAVRDSTHIEAELEREHTMRRKADEKVDMLSKALVKLRRENYELKQQLEDAEADREAADEALARVKRKAGL